MTEVKQLGLVSGVTGSLIHSSISPFYTFVPIIEGEFNLSLLSEGSLVNHFKSPDDFAEAVAIFNPEDLTQLNRVLIRYGNEIFEFSRCHPVVGFCPKPEGRRKRERPPPERADP